MSKIKIRTINKVELISINLTDLRPAQKKHVKVTDIWAPPHHGIYTGDVSLFYKKLGLRSHIDRWFNRKHK